MINEWSKMVEDMVDFYGGKYGMKEISTGDVKMALFDSGALYINALKNCIILTPEDSRVLYYELRELYRKDEE